MSRTFFPLIELKTGTLCYELLCAAIFRLEARAEYRLARVSKFWCRTIKTAMPRIFGGTNLPRIQQQQTRGDSDYEIWPLIPSHPRSQIKKANFPTFTLQTPLDTEEVRIGFEIGDINCHALRTSQPLLAMDFYRLACTQIPKPSMETYEELPLHRKWNSDDDRTRLEFHVQTLIRPWASPAGSIAGIKPDFVICSADSCYMQATMKPKVIYERIPSLDLHIEPEVKRSLGAKIQLVLGWNHNRLVLQSISSVWQICQPDFKSSQEERALIYDIRSKRPIFPRDITPPTEKETTTESREKTLAFCLKPLTLSWFKMWKMQIDVVPKKSRAEEEDEEDEEKQLASRKRKREGA